MAERPGPPLVDRTTAQTIDAAVAYLIANGQSAAAAELAKMPIGDTQLPARLSDVALKRPYMPPGVAGRSARSGWIAGARHRQEPPPTWCSGDRKYLLQVSRRLGGC